MHTTELHSKLLELRYFWSDFEFYVDISFGLQGPVGVCWIIVSKWYVQALKEHDIFHSM